MAIRREYPVAFTARGLTDAWDASRAFEGACTSLQNLTFDQSNPDLMTCRPGVGSPLTTFSSFTGATGITVFAIIGNICYGLISTTRLGSKDEPFAYNLVNNSFLTITGTLSTNLPTTQVTTGDWVPPTIAVVGNNIIFTHPGFNGNVQTGTFTASISGSLLTVTAAGTAGTAGSLHLGANISGTSIVAGTSINGFVSGVEGGAGVYTLNTTYASPVASETMTAVSGNYFGILNLNNPVSPAWFSSNTGVFSLPSVPIAVTNFNNRAYFACSNQAFYSDTLQPTSMGTAGQALTVGDTTNITGFSGLPIQTSTTGVISALMVFKSFQVWQITGDASIASNPLSQNFLSLNVGCTSPRSICQTPAGLFFIGIDGPYYISSLGQVLPLTKDANKLTQDVQRPFQNIINPSRASACFSGAIYRICITTLINGVSQQADYWFDVTVRRWTGPHTFGYDMCFQYANYFIISNQSIGASLYSSHYIPNTTSVYLDNTTPITINLQSSFLPKTQNINVKQIVVSTIELSNVAYNLQYNITALGEQYQILNNANISSSNNVLTWGQSGATWGQYGVTWSSGLNSPSTFTIPWTAPIVFKKISLLITATSSYNLEIGTVFFKYQDTGMTNF